MIAHLAPEKNNAGIEDERQIEHDVSQKVGALPKETFSLRISCGRKIENVSCTLHLGMRGGSLPIRLPALQDSRSTQKLFDLAIFVDGGVLP